jgi:hypothetical protein
MYRKIFKHLCNELAPHPEIGLNKLPFLSFKFQHDELKFNYSLLTSCSPPIQRRDLGSAETRKHNAHITFLFSFLATKTTRSRLSRDAETHYSLLITHELFTFNF